MRRELITSFVFGGLNIVVSIIANVIMLSAVITMHRLQKKNGFENKQFDEIQFNFAVSILICLGYIVDYVITVTIYILRILTIITYNTAQYYQLSSQLFLIISIFFAYIILMRIFLTYHR